MFDGNRQHVRLGALAALVFWAVAPAQAADEKPQRDPKKDPAFWKRVDKSMDAGVAWLLTRQQTNGRFPGYGDARGEIYPTGMHALAMLACLKAGLDPDSRPMSRAIRALHSLYRTHKNALKTYEVAVALMALDAYYFAVPPKKARKGKKPKKKAKMAAEDLELAKALHLWLESKQRPAGMWRYPEDGMDLSNTQYAVLGLWSAQRLGLKLDRGVLRRSLEIVLQRQQPTGPEVRRFVPSSDRRYGKWIKTAQKFRARGWRYMPDHEIVERGRKRKIVYPISGSMTSAGVAILAIARHLLGKDPWMTRKRDRNTRVAMFDGLAWLQHHWTVLDNPKQPGSWTFYWLYGLERAARLVGVENVGPHDWYVEGAQRLFADQRQNGSWPKKPRPRPKKDANVRWWSDQVDTCFAILFLARATPDLDVPEPVISGSTD